MQQPDVVPYILAPLAADLALFGDLMLLYSGLLPIILEGCCDT